MRWNKVSDTGESAANKTPVETPKAPASKAIELRETFIARTPRRNLDDLIVPARVREQVDLLLRKIENHHVLYHEWGLAALDPSGDRTAINLYGPPGTGKTMCAEAIAHALGQKMIDVNYAEIESKYVGDTSKNIVLAFETAKEENALLFFDEADSILGKRLTDVRQSADHSVNTSRSVMLKQLEAFEGVVVFATNMAKNYDGAFVRRILGHVEFELPDQPTRIRLWERYLLDTLPLADDVHAESIATFCDGLSGGEMLNVLIGAAAAAVGRSADEQKITLEDFRSQAETTRRVREEIGDFNYDRNVTVTREIVDLADVPVSE